MTKEAEHAVDDWMQQYIDTYLFYKKVDHTWQQGRPSFQRIHSTCDTPSLSLPGLCVSVCLCLCMGKGRGGDLSGWVQVGFSLFGWLDWRMWMRQYADTYLFYKKVDHTWQ